MTIRSKLQSIVDKLDYRDAKLTWIPVRTKHFARGWYLLYQNKFRHQKKLWLGAKFEQAERTLNELERNRRSKKDI